MTLIASCRDELVVAVACVKRVSRSDTLCATDYVRQNTANDGMMLETGHLWPFQVGATPTVKLRQ